LMFIVNAWAAFPAEDRMPVRGSEPLIPPFLQPPTLRHFDLLADPNCFPAQASPPFVKFSEHQQSNQPLRFAAEGEIVMPKGPAKRFNNITSLAKMGAPSTRAASNYFAGLLGTSERGSPKASGSVGFITRLRRVWQVLASAIYRGGPPSTPDH
jgi:hypothetical protein